MIVIPAIDILGGRVARLTRGDFKFEKTYEGTPLEIAGKWESLGAGMIHVVDLDGAKTGVFKNLKLIGDIASSVKAGIELGGGLRDRPTIKKALTAGISRVIIGTRAVDKNFVMEIMKEFGKEKVIVGVDSREGKISVSGWTETKDIYFLDFIKILEDLDVGTIVFTDILKDGTLSGPNFDALNRVLDATDMDVIASGGVSSIDDILKLKKLAPKGLAGCIVGKALYEGRLDLRQAIEIAKDNKC
ncbi:MAG: 1-(5-phosphoribosyl)-5-[(5-phosphoribosylamino)methylideneamino]imidazole-4-carboxamide isomerase [Candidatus Omnitrophica bacterium]|nr:1-(5-phosphoribosyl)-5-[(5-phosphoribosylamino)methylideneamino]imidazole-4-carboxamide isomerase [Candidatus Omnitrophota bacterium]